jgi:hypothetical protein
MLDEPGGEFVWWQDAKIGVHAVVAEPTKLGAEDGVSACFCWGEVKMDGLAGDRILFEAHLRDGETVDNVLRAEPEVDFAVGWEDEFGGDEVV